MESALGTNHYEVLGIAPGAAQDQVEAAGRRQLFRWHPDRNPTCRAEAERRFVCIREALVALRDPVQRAAYDQLNGFAPAPNSEVPRDVRFERTITAATRVVTERVQLAGQITRERAGLFETMEALAAEARLQPFISRSRFYGCVIILVASALFYYLMATTVFDGPWVWASFGVLILSALVFARTAFFATGQRLARERYRDLAEILTKRVTLHPNSKEESPRR
jgi:hypothetical protein